MMHAMGLGSLGIGFFVAGLVPLVLLGSGIYLLVRRLRGDHRPELDSSTERRRSGKLPTEAAPTARVFRLAKRYGGVLTVSDVVTELGIDPEDAEKLLDSVTDGNRVDINVDNDGVVRYVFSELAS